MTDQEIIKSFQDAGALLDGHFVLRSGMHSNKFFQCALLFRYPDVAEKLFEENEKDAKERRENYKKMAAN